MVFAATVTPRLAVPYRSPAPHSVFVVSGYAILNNRVAATGTGAGAEAGDMIDACGVGACGAAEAGGIAARITAAAPPAIAAALETRRVLLAITLSTPCLGSGWRRVRRWLGRSRRRRSTC